MVGENESLCRGVVTRKRDCLLKGNLSFFFIPLREAEPIDPQTGSNTSAPSNLDFRVEFFEFGACVFDGEVPVDSALFGICPIGPGFDF